MRKHRNKEKEEAETPNSDGLYICQGCKQVIPAQNFPYPAFQQCFDTYGFYHFQCLDEEDRDNWSIRCEMNDLPQRHLTQPYIDERKRAEAKFLTQYPDLKEV